MVGVPVDVYVIIFELMFLKNTPEFFVRCIYIYSNEQYYHYFLISVTSNIHVNEEVFLITRAGGVYSSPVVLLCC